MWTPPEEDQINTNWAPPVEDVIDSPTPATTEQIKNFNPQNLEKMEGGVTGMQNYPESLYTDPSVQDAQTVAGLAGLAKAGTGLALRGAGKALNGLELTKNIVPTIGDTADDMLLKSMGTRAAQAKQLGGIEEARETAKLARRAGADDIFSTERGSRDQVKNLIQSEGKEIGALRQEAGKAPADYYQTVEQDLMKKYSPKNPDVYSAGKPQVKLGLNTIKNVANEAEPTHANIAKGITDLNRFSTGEKLVQPNTPLVKVAQKAANANDAGIVQSLGPDKGKRYLDALKNETGAFHLQDFVEKGAQREALSRGGHGNFISSMAQKALDAGGYRAGSKGLNAIHGAMNEFNPALGTNEASFSAQKLEDYLRNKYDR